MNTPSDRGNIAPFGTEIGRAPGNVAVYSSDYTTADPVALPTRFHYRNFVDSVYTGHKWQCVEFARRWLLLNHGYVFADIAMAYDIFILTHAKHIKDKKQLQLHSFENGSQRRPEPGCMLIWDEGGEFAVTGHVAIITEVFDDRVRIAEQNVANRPWPEGRDYARELTARVDTDGSYWISCSFADTAILGWVIQTDDAAHAVAVDSRDDTLFSIELRSTEFIPARKSWLNIARPDEAAYVANNGHTLCSLPQRANNYLAISRSAAKELKRATNELHALFMHATEYVMTHEQLWQYFNIPAELWPRIKQCWNDRRNHMVTGRFDFCMTRDGIKVYEYNCDSASCHMEAGKVQGLWAHHYHCDDGDDAGKDLFDHLVDAWRIIPIDGLLHLLLDDNEEEKYHTLFMREAIMKAGLQVELIQGFDDTRWTVRNDIVDSKGKAIQRVWKTWAWETALDQLRLEIQRQEIERGGPHEKTPRLMDILLHPGTTVFEPLWTLVPSNKAILPVLWEMFPQHPYLLESSFEATASLQEKGFVAKPIAGRSGHNISIIDPSRKVLSQTDGKFNSQDTIYQELCPLPKIEDLRIQLCAFSVWGTYAGACARVDNSLIITTDSQLMPLRIVSDRQFHGE